MKVSPNVGTFLEPECWRGLQRKIASHARELPLNRHNFDRSKIDQRTEVGKTLLQRRSKRAALFSKPVIAMIAQCAMMLSTQS